MINSSVIKKDAYQLNTLINDFSALYKVYLPKIKKCIYKLDASAGYKRSEDGIEDIAQGFFAEVWEKKRMDNFDIKRAKKSKDPILTFLFNHLRNFYRSKRTLDLKENDTKKQLTEENKINGLFYNQNFEFCYDIKRKLHKSLFKSFNLLEKKAWAIFMYNKCSVKKAATMLGVSVGTAFLLKNSIYDKAEGILSNYYSGGI